MRAIKDSLSPYPLAVVTGETLADVQQDAATKGLPSFRSFEMMRIGHKNPVLGRSVGSFLRHAGVYRFPEAINAAESSLAITHGLLSMQALVGVWSDPSTREKIMARGNDVPDLTYALPVLSDGTEGGVMGASKEYGPQAFLDSMQDFLLSRNGLVHGAVDQVLDELGTTDDELRNVGHTTAAMAHMLLASQAHVDILNGQLEG